MPAPGRLGRIPRDTTRFAPTLEHYLRKHPVTAKTGLEQVADSEDVDRASKVTEWPIYRNDTIGDCTIADQAHGDTALGVYAGKPQWLFSDDAIIRAYSDVSGYDPATGANDNGAQIQDVLAYMRTTGIPDTSGDVHKVVSYAALGRPSDITLLSECLKTFGTVHLGINCPQSALDQFDAGEPWTVVPGSPPVGGHAVALHRRQPYGSRIGVWQVSTWGRLQPVTIPFLAHFVEEAWVGLSQDWLEANGSSCDGVSLAQLEHDMRYV